MKIFRLLVVCLSMVLCMILSGCLSPVKLKPTNAYLLNTLPDVSVRRTHSSTIMVAVPETREAFDTTQMAYSMSRYQIAYYGLNNWAEPPGEMLQPLIVQTLQNTHYFHAVVIPPFGGVYDYLLKTQILDLRQDYTQSPRMFRISIRAQLISARTGRVIATKLIKVSQPIYQCTPYSGVRAGNIATALALKEIARFAISH